MTDERLPRFPSHNESNYSEWSIQMEAELVRNALYSQVFFTVDTAGKDEDTIKADVDRLRARWTATKMAEARAEIITCVEASQLSHMRDQDPAVIWKTLEMIHKARGLATRLALRRKFLTAVKESESMSAWIGCVKTMAFELEDIDVVVTDEDRILVLTMGLDNSYDSFVISLDTTPADQLTLGHVIDHLINKEVRRDNRRGSSGKASTA